ncbi:MAG: hypothetical protein WC869_12160 [Phycisphaerae bacterium]|jgi:hypothetical protein
MDIENATQELKVIRQLMERPVRYSSMSGAAGVLAGAFALAGAVVDRLLGHQDTLVLTSIIWGAVFCLAAAGDILLTRAREKRMGMPFWTSIKRRMLMTILPPFIVGGAMTLALLDWHPVPYSHLSLVPALWMVFYGLALWQAGDFSIAEVRGMGACFILAAPLTATFCQGWPALAMAITFGGFHLVYGTVVWIRHGG